jgi:hypothetical protein
LIGSPVLASVMRKVTSAQSAATTLSLSSLVGLVKNSTITPSRVMRLAFTCSSVAAVSTASVFAVSAVSVTGGLPPLCSVSGLQAVNRPMAVISATRLARRINA